MKAFLKTNVFWKLKNANENEQLCHPELVSGSLKETEILNSNKSCKTEQSTFQNDSVGNVIAGLTRNRVPEAHHPDTKMQGGTSNGRGKRKIAFTLAEVLITLGIIGIVAAMTMPALISKFRNKALESQYKKTFSNISQAILLAKTDMGIERFRQYCVEHSANAPAGSNGYINKEECYKYLNKIALGRKIKTLSRSGNEIKSYNSKQFVNYKALAGMGTSIFSINVMPDGSFINHYVIEGNFYIGFDVNGYKKPNKLGHDVFIFRLNNNDFLTDLGQPRELSDEQIKNDAFDNQYGTSRAGNPCSLTSNQGANGIGCSYYVLRDECPYDKTKKYFECLPN